jgi:hypothetical protein
MPTTTNTSEQNATAQDFMRVVHALDMIPLDSDLNTCCLKIAVEAK